METLFCTLKNTGETRGLRIYVRKSTAGVSYQMMMVFLRRLCAVFKIPDPAGNCPEHSHGFLGLMEIPGLGKNPVITLRDHFVDHLYTG